MSRQQREERRAREHAKLEALRRQLAAALEAGLAECDRLRVENRQLALDRAQDQLQALGLRIRVHERCVALGAENDRLRVENAALWAAVCDCDGPRKREAT